MTKNFLIIAITPPDFRVGEAKRINEILSEGKAQYVHIRKPECSAIDISRLIDQIHPRFHSRLKLHDHFELIDKYNIGGIHLNSRNSGKPNLKLPKSLEISKSIHKLEEIPLAENFDYFFLSPVFDSITKEGYKAAFELDQISINISGKKAVALGGVTPDKFVLLKSLGFYGAALLGYFFPR